MRRTLLLLAPLMLVACMPPMTSEDFAPSSQSSSLGSLDSLTSSSFSSSWSSSSSNPSLPSSSSLPSTPSSILTIGDASSPTLLLFTHHSCAYCKTFHDQLMPRLVEEYIRPGKLRMQIVPIMLNKYAASMDQAKLLICAVQQGKGMEVHGALFNSPVATVRTQAELGLDIAALDACMNNAETMSALEAQSLFAASFDATLVPTYFINETRYQGLPEWADLRGQIELELD